ncbi:MAG: SpoIIE family protein phosphatase [Rectinemataceae bacterium]
MHEPMSPSFTIPGAGASDATHILHATLGELASLLRASQVRAAESGDAQTAELCARAEELCDRYGAAGDATDIAIPSFNVLFRLHSLCGRIARAELAYPKGTTPVILPDLCRSMIALARGGLKEPAPDPNLATGTIAPRERTLPQKPGTIVLTLGGEIGDMLTRKLESLGHRVIRQAGRAETLIALGIRRTSRGTAARQATASAPTNADSAAATQAPPYEMPDLVIHDLFSSGLPGFELQERLKEDSAFADTRVLILSPLRESECIARAIQLGADDFLATDVVPAVLFARIDSCIERRRSRARRRLYLAALAEAQGRLEAELKRGSEYVRGLLPGKISREGFSADWLFLPSADLGGDLFDYWRLDDGRTALYLLDVSGHGVESALYSVTIGNTLRSEGLRSVDFGDPARALSGLNRRYRMEERNNLLFTIWYGVWDPRSRVLTYSSAGSPPAVLMPSDGEPLELKTTGTVAGADPDAEYVTRSISLAKGSRLYLFSDGIYEFHTKDGVIFGLKAFVSLLERTAAGMPKGRSAIDTVLAEVSSRAVSSRFQDDLSFLEFRFDY